MSYLVTGRRIRTGVLALVLLTAVTVGLGQAQEPGPGEEPQPRGANSPAGVQSIVTHDIPIQGRLTDADGHPVPDGTYAITFRLYNAEVGGDLLCQDADHPPVTDGLFTALMGPCTADDINGQELWLSIQVEGDPEMDPRQKIAPVPYARSLRPGAVISDTRDGILTVQSTGSGDADALIAIADGTGEAVTAYSPDSIAVWAYSDTSLAVQGYSYSPAAAGPTIYGCKAADPGTCDAHQVVMSTAVQGFSTVGVGVYGQSDTSRGVYGFSDTGTGVHGVSNSGYAGFFSGSCDVGQSREGDGLVKAAVRVNCDDDGSHVNRFFNNVNTVDPTIADGPSAGRCTIDFGFQINDRYFVATAFPSDSGSARGVSCAWGADNEKLDCFRWDAAGDGMNGQINILVY
jgi:hypothetical protein